MSALERHCHRPRPERRAQTHRLSRDRRSQFRCQSAEIRSRDTSAHTPGRHCQRRQGGQIHSRSIRGCREMSHRGCCNSFRRWNTVRKNDCRYYRSSLKPMSLSVRYILWPKMMLHRTDARCAPSICERHICRSRRHGSHRGRATTRSRHFRCGATSCLNCRFRP